MFAGAREKEVDSHAVMRTVGSEDVVCVCFDGDLHGKRCVVPLICM